MADPGEMLGKCSMVCSGSCIREPAGKAWFADLFTEADIDEDAGIATLACVQRAPHDTLARHIYGKIARFEPGHSGTTVTPTTRYSVW